MSKTQEKVNEVISSLDELKSCFNNEIKELNEEVQILEKRKLDLLDVKKKIDISLISDPITLDIGGVKFKTTKSTLTKVKGTFFDAMFSGQFEIKSLSDNSSKFFIDRDGTHFRYILNYMRDGEMQSIPSSIKKEVLKEMEYYNFDIDTLLPKSDLITNEHFKIIDGWLGSSKTYNLIFKATIDGFEAAKFHSKCDGKGATITIIKSNDGNVFGGYNSQSWNGSNSGYYGDTNCFLFTIINKNNIKPTQYSHIGGTNLHFIYGQVAHGPTFGGGHDLHIADKCNINTTSYQNFPHSYCDISGKGRTTFASSYNFTVEDYEVFTLL